MHTTLPLVSIIIVNWNGLADLKSCLASLKKVKYPNLETIIVDNGSNDGSQQYIKSQKSKVKNVTLIQNTSNVGYAEGNNIGYRKAKGQYLLLLNNDTVIENDFLTPLVEKMDSDSAIAGVQPIILQFPNKKLIDSIGSYFITTGFLYHLGHNKPDQKKYQKPNDVFSMKGACMLLRKSVIDKVGLFDTDYFAYFEETDLCMRIWISGSKIVYLPQSTIYHKGGETFKRLDNSFLLFHSYKNRIYTYAKNFEVSTLVLVLPLHLAMCLLVIGMYTITLRFSSSLAIIRALIWNVTNLSKTAQNRTKVATLRKISDNSYLTHLTRQVRLSYYYHLFTTSLRGYKD